MTTGFKVHDFLRGHDVAFEVVPHPKCYTAAETAESEHIAKEMFAKVVIVKIKGKDAMFVIPADRRIDLLKLSFELGTDDLRVEEESEMQDLFTDCEKGAMPPFGSLYHLPCYVDIVLENQKEIVFNAGSHTESIKMSVKDYFVLAEAEVGDYSVPK